MKRAKTKLIIEFFLLFLLLFFFDIFWKSLFAPEEKKEVVIHFSDIQYKIIDSEIYKKQDINLENANVISFTKVKSDLVFSSLNEQEKRLINEAKGSRCVFKENWNWAIISPECFFSNFSEYYTKDTDSFTGSVEWIWEHIDNFSNTYELYSAEFEYEDSKPIFKEDDLNRFYSFLESVRKNWYDKSLIWKLISDKNFISLTQEEFLILKTFNYNYYVAKRDKLDQLWNCSKTNYDVALIAIDKKLVKPWDIFNINKRLAYRIWYCASNEDDYDNYVFQSWVCGASTQVFRVGLIHPEIEIAERHAHRTRYERYYDTTIWWDDATIIEFRKSLRLKNISDSDIYFKFIDKWGYALLAWISPKKSDKKVKISRGQTWELSWKVKKEVYTRDWKFLSEREWESTYVNISTMRVR